eukprot:CAMPEP_0202387124 /NCGR_PEP_ID=MMETSP1127-20130417/70258_1 /ASSEMBLY_ACC=CAM_ASM_000462 /TAXON_ID=3047 /ORGANISM="Dunaliella tertiolecta, Strain CCMP1320" /LENGTH=65 /DNA_ID=CAMNT_0048987965 /DNA_START=1071 /DNA_END=1268 /DNA_ORIENTATION=-
MTGSIMRTWAKKADCVDPKMLFMTRSRPPVWAMPSQTGKRNMTLSTDVLPNPAAACSGVMKRSAV